MGKQLNRRQFLKTLGAGAATLMAAACTPTEPPKPAPTTAAAPPAPAPTAAAAAAAKPTAAAAAQGDKVVVGVSQWGTETSLPYKMMNNEFTLWGPVFDGLLFRDPKTLELKPGLATSWDHSPDYKTWTFKLRQGVMFHENWGEFTSDDVKFGVEQLLKPGGSNATVNQQIDHVDTPDKYTAVIQCKMPSWIVPSLYAPYSGTPELITSRKYIETVGEEKANLHPIGTGPLRHLEGQQGTYHRFEAVPNHWRQTAGFKQLEIRRVPDPATRTAGVRSGEIDVGIVYGDYLDQAKRANLQIFQLPNAAQYWIVITGQTTPGHKDYSPQSPWAGDPNDPKSMEKARNVRLALNLAVNKQAIIDGIWKGYGSLTPFSYVYYPVNKGYSADWKIPPYDPQRAKQMLADAGYPNGFEVKVNPGVVGLYAPDGPDVMEAVAQDWEKIGLKVTRQPEDWGSFVAKVRARDTGLRFWPYGTCVFAEPGEIWSRVFGSSEGSLLLLADGPFDTALKAIDNEVDPEKRTQLTHDLGQMMYEGYYGVMIGIRTSTWAMTKKVAGWNPLPISLESNYESITWSGQ